MSCTCACAGPVTASRTCWVSAWFAAKPAIVASAVAVVVCAKTPKALPMASPRPRCSSFAVAALAAKSSFRLWASAEMATLMLASEVAMAPVILVSDAPMALTAESSTAPSLVTSSCWPWLRCSSIVSTERCSLSSFSVISDGMIGVCGGMLT